LNRKGYIWTLVLTLYVSLSWAQQDVPLDTLCIFDPPSHLATEYHEGFRYQWNVNGGQIISNPDSNTVLVDWGNQPGLFSVRLAVFDTETGCFGDTLNASIFLQAPVRAQAKSPTAACQGDIITLESQVQGDFVWENGSTHRYLTFEAEEDTSIYLVALNDHCNNDTTRFFITVEDRPLASINDLPDTVQIYTQLRIYFTGSASQEGEVNWYIDEMLRGSGPVLDVELTQFGRHNIMQVVNNQYCSDTIRKSVYVNDQYTAHFPNTFTPNGDGINDLWIFKGVGHASFVAEIYNRWGELVYSWTDESPVNGWDGTNQGQPSKMDTYIYRVEITDLKGREHYYTDRFNLAR